VPGVEVVLEPEHERIRSRWPEQWLDCVTDASDYVLGRLTPDGEQVLQAVRTGSPYLTYLHHTTGYFAPDAPGFSELRRRLESLRGVPSQE
jgi:hypothetical protein